MKKYTKPEMEEIILTRDVITASNTEVETEWDDNLQNQEK